MMIELAYLSQGIRGGPVIHASEGTFRIRHDLGGGDTKVVPSRSLTSPEPTPKQIPCRLAPTASMSIRKSNSPRNPRIRRLAKQEILTPKRIPKLRNWTGLGI